MNNNNQSDGICAKKAMLTTVGMVLLGLLVVAQVMQAWGALYGNSGRFGHIASIARGSLCAVTLTTGQVYYGNLADASDGYLRLTKVYYVQQNGPQPNGAPMQFHLVNKQKNDWHGPEWMAIPDDKIMFVENVGKGSRLADLITKDNAAVSSAVP